MRGRRHDQSGNILVMFAILLPLFTFTAAVVIDVGYWWANARKAQIAADACALAAAKDLPAPSPGGWNRGECVHEGLDYVLTNLPPQGAGSEPEHVSTRVVSPFEGNATQVEATVRLKVRTFFGRFIGLSGVDLQRRAVAEQAIGQGNYAIYAHSSDCPAHGGGTSLLFNGKNHGINGRVHSNGEYRVANQAGPPPDFQYFWAKEGTMDGCFHDDPPGSAHFGGSDYAHHTSTAPEDRGPQSWPAWWTPSDFGWVNGLDLLDGCDVKGKTIEIKESGGNTIVEVKAPPGIDHILLYPGGTIPLAQTYCASEKFTINRDNLDATMTVLAPEITVDGNNQTLRAHEGTASGKVLFFVVPNITSAFDGAMPLGNPDCNPDPAKELKLNGNGHRWNGVIFNPCGEVVVNVGGATAGNSNITGTILGLKVRVNGENFLMTGESNFGGTVILALDQ